MKTVLAIITTMAFLGMIVTPTPVNTETSLILLCETEDGNSSTICWTNPTVDQTWRIEDEIKATFKSGNLAVVMEPKSEVLWIYLNDVANPDYFPIADEKLFSEFLETLGLFPIKFTKELENELKDGIPKLLGKLGIKYQVKNGEITSDIDPEKFEQYVHSL